QAYKANTKEFYYGFDSAVKHSADLGLAVLEPNAGFNFTGLYSDDIKESKDGLRIKDNNTISALAYAGADIKKKFAFDKDNALSLTAGGKYFHEFGDEYKARTTVSDMIGHYDIKDNRAQRNFGLVNLRAKYDYRQFSIEASMNTPIERKHNPYYLLNMGYKF
ncbi:MAG: autotransporter domain-containing protein, partial [Alphaproteobacteria bacterium]|nr:autotransporter domain-containing protein [Alphaproteobacteria bacterium]